VSGADGTVVEIGWSARYAQWPDGKLASNLCQVTVSDEDAKLIANVAQPSADDRAVHGICCGLPVNNKGQVDPAKAEALFAILSASLGIAAVSKTALSKAVDLAVAYGLKADTASKIRADLALAALPPKTVSS
jgi:hypothetical protein